MASLDPADERSDERPKSSYITKKDLKILAIVLAVLGLMLTPVYLVMKRNTDKYLCGLNIKALGDAALLYAQANDDRLPPVSDNNGAPSFREGQLYCWATIPSIRGSIEPHRSLRCPSAEDNEAVEVVAANHLSEPLTYGMYLPLGGMPISSVENPAMSLMMAETSNFGAHDTYDPKPYLDSSGKAIPSDAYVIGWDTGNLVPEAKTRTVTRLAFYDTKNGHFEEKGSSRHQGNLYFMNLEGHRSFLNPTAANVYIQESNGRPRPPWAVPYSYIPGRG